MHLMSPWSMDYTLHVIHLQYMGKNKDSISIGVSGVPLYEIIQDYNTLNIAEISTWRFSTPRSLYT